MPDDARSLVLGIEAGGAAVSALLADSTGAMLGIGRAAGATPTSYPTEVVGERLAGAIIAALGAVPHTRVAAAVVGMAGLNEASDAGVHEVLDRVWGRVGLDCPVRVVADPVAAFAGGTPAPRGAVLIAGAGSIAAWVDGQAVAHRVAGHGWLISDDGSGFWIGRQAVRAVLDELDGRGEPTLLRMAVVGTLADSDELPSSPREQLALLRAGVYSQPPIALARLAPLVPAAAEVGDRVAQRIVDRAVTLLVDTLDALVAELPPDDVKGAPIVLAGELLTAPGRIRSEIHRRVADRYGHEPLFAPSGAAGAAWLALGDSLGDTGGGPDPRAHAQLRQPLP